MDPYTKRKILLDLDIDDLVSVCQTDKSYLDACSNYDFWKVKNEKDGLYPPSPIASRTQQYIDDYLNQIYHIKETEFLISHLKMLYYGHDDTPFAYLNIPKDPELLWGYVDQDTLDSLFQYFDYSTISLEYNEGGYYMTIIRKNPDMYRKIKYTYEEMYNLISHVLSAGSLIDDVDLTNLLYDNQSS